jgi:putative peptidoglycan binding protein
MRNDRKADRLRNLGMKKNKLLSLIGSAVVGLGSSAWAAPHAAPAYDDHSAYVDSDRYGNNATVREVQSALAKLRYYRGAIDGIVGDETQAALARYQEDRDLSVTGTLTAATLQSLGLAWTTS